MLPFPAGTRRGLITEPAAGEAVDRGRRRDSRGGLVRRAIARMDVSVGDGAWQHARPVGERKQHSWQWWELVMRNPVELNVPSFD